MLTNYSANGKVLLTAEYAVLDGALAIGIPTQLGQKLAVRQTNDGRILWTAFLPEQKHWFYAHYDLNGLDVMDTDNHDLANKLIEILIQIRELNPDFLNSFNGIEINTYLGFDKNWGLGSSSTLISLLAQWAKVNPYDLLNRTFGGSGYDLACATSVNPVFFRLINNGKEYYVREIDFMPKFHKHLFFMYLNQKQNSRDGIKMYRKQPYSSSFIEQISQISEQLIKVEDLDMFEGLLNQHEDLISSQIKLPRVGEVLFSDYTAGVVKSLGAWGGDFVLVTSQSGDMDYFKEKGYEIVIPYMDFVK